MLNKNILIQGAIDIEIESLISELDNLKSKNISGYNFYEGIIGNKTIIVSKTEIGSINSTISTIIGINIFHPNIVINQGIAGAHLSTIHTGDIIIGEACCNINAFSIPPAKSSEGSSPFKWEPNKRAKEIKYSDKTLVDFFYNNLSNSNHIVYKGILGSGDVFNREYDRIKWTHNLFGNLCEDMESIGTYSACSKFNIPCIGIRIISNNELTLEKINKKKALDLQKLLVNILRKI